MAYHCLGLRLRSSPDGVMYIQGMTSSKGDGSNGGKVLETFALEGGTFFYINLYMTNTTPTFLFSLLTHSTGGSVSFVEDSLAGDAQTCLPEHSIYDWEYFLSF